MFETLTWGSARRLLDAAARPAALALAVGLTACGGGGGGAGTDNAAASYPLSVAISGSGTVVAPAVNIDCGSACSATVPANTSVTLTATPAAGQSLQAWGGACSNAIGNRCTLVMNQAASVTAAFVALPTAGWSNTPTPLSVGGSCCAKLALDATGRAVAVWFTQEPGTITDSLMTSRFTPSTGWSTPLALESSPRDVGTVELAMDPATGRAVVMWTQGSDTSLRAAWARHYDPASGWTSAQPVQSASTPAGRADRVSVGIDAQGNAVAAWSQLDGTRINIWGNRGTAAGTWGGAQLLETVDEVGRADGNPRIAVAPQGDATVVWQASGGTVANRGTWTNRYASGAGWGTASQLVVVSGGSAPDIAMDGSGNAVMVWGQVEVVSPTDQFALIQARRYQAGAWGPVVQVGREPGANSVVSAPQVTMNAGGSALVVWGQGDESIRARAAAARAAWPAPSTIKAARGRDVRSAPVSAIDGHGQVMITWAQGNDQGGTDAMLATRAAHGTWAAGSVHQAAIWGDPFVALNDRGDGLFLWTQLVNATTGTQVQARRYASGR